MPLWEILVISGRGGKGRRHEGSLAWKPHSRALLMQSITKERSTDSFQTTDSLNYWHWSGPEKRSWGKIKRGVESSITGNLNTFKSCKETEHHPMSPSPQSQALDKAFKVSLHWPLVRSWYVCAHTEGRGTGEEKIGVKGQSFTAITRQDSSVFPKG